MARRAFGLSAWLAALLLCVWFAFFRTPIVSDVSRLMSPGDDIGRLLDELRASAVGRLILVGLEGGTEEARAETSRRLVEALRQTGTFPRVANGAETLNEADQRTLFAHRYLLSPTVSSERFSDEALRAALQQRIMELRSPVSALEKRLLPEDPTGEFLSLVRVWLGGQRQPAKRRGVWFSPDGARALVVVESRASGLDTEAQAHNIAAIEKAFAAARGDTEVSLLLGGPGVIATASERIIRDEATFFSIASMVCIIVVLGVSFRSPRIILLCPLAPLFAVAVGAAAVGLLYGGIYGITLGFGATVFGVASDYPLHLFSHLHEGETIRETLRQIWPTVRLCVVTTAMGYLAIVSRDFPILTQVAVFSVAGLVAAAAVTRWVLPELLPSAWAGQRAFRDSWMTPLLQQPASRRTLGAGVVALLVMSGALAFAAPLHWENDLAALSPLPRPVLARDAQLRADLGAPEGGHMVVARAPSAEIALQKSERAAAILQTFADEGALAGFQAPSSYLSSQATQRLRQSALPTRERLQADLDRAQAGLPFKPGLFAPFVDAVEAARTGPLLAPQDLADTPLGLRLGGLLFQNDSGWTALLPLTGIADAKRLTEAISSVGDPDIGYIDLRRETNRLGVEFRDTALLRLGGGTVLLFLVLWVGLKSPARALAVLLPVALAGEADLLVLSLLGEHLSLFHLISLILVVGISIDYNLFFSRVFLSRADPDVADRRRTLRALGLCCATTVAGFGPLSFSSLPVLEAIGSTVAIGVIAGLLFAVALSRPVLPPMPQGPKTCAQARGFPDRAPLAHVLDTR